jgi:hypothetical protein
MVISIFCEDTISRQSQFSQRMSFEEYNAYYDIWNNLPCLRFNLKESIVFVFITQKLFKKFFFNIIIVVQTLDKN